MGHSQSLWLQVISRHCVNKLHIHAQRVETKFANENGINLQTVKCKDVTKILLEKKEPDRPGTITGRKLLFMQLLTVKLLI